jgi:hypothetical protein
MKVSPINRFVKFASTLARKGLKALPFALLAATLSARAEIVAGPAYSHFRLTLDVGERTEAVGPFWYSDEIEDQTRWAVPPLMSWTHDHGVDSDEFDFLYPIITWDRFGEEYRFQILQVFNFAGGAQQNDTNVHRFSLFPLYLQQRSADKSKNYTSVMPFYGHLENRLFRDKIDFVMLPLWVKTEKKGVTTENYVYPIGHRRHGPGLEGWQVWPLVGHEHKVPTTTTNHWGDEIPSPGHNNWFVLWPFFVDSHQGLGSTNPVHQQLSVPLYSFTRSPNRDSTSIPFLLGWTKTVDREKKYKEIGAPWPIIVFRRGESANTDRVWPFYSYATNEFLESKWYLWPIYKYNRFNDHETVDRDRMRIFFFLYSDTTERHLETHTVQRRRDCWPLFIHREELNGNKRLQILAPLEPLLPNNKSIERDYSPVWSLWRAEHNPNTRSSSQSLLWNLYRRDKSPERTRTSVFFGVVQREKNTSGSHWKFFGI